MTEANFKASMGLDFQRGDIAKAKTKVGFAKAANEKAEEMFREQTIGLHTR